MQVRQSRIYHGDTKFYIETANGFIVSEGFDSRGEAEAELADRHEQVEREVGNEGTAA